MSKSPTLGLNDKGLFIGPNLGQAHQDSDMSSSPSAGQSASMDRGVSGVAFGQERGEHWDNQGNDQDELSKRILPRWAR